MLDFDLSPEGRPEGMGFGGEGGGWPTAAEASC